MAENAELAGLSLAFANGQSIRVGQTTAVRELRSAADMAAVFLNIEVWDEAVREPDPSESLLFRDLGTGKYDPDVERRIGSWNDVKKSKLIVVLVLIAVILLLL